MLIDQIIKEQSKAANMYINLNNVINSILQRASSKSINDSNDFKDLIDAVKEINNMYQNDNITNGHIRTSKLIFKISFYVLHVLFLIIIKLQRRNNIFYLL